MPYLNHVTLMGHLTADPELKRTPAGDAVTTFTVGINFKLKSGEQRAEFFDCEAWKGWAENLCRTAKKGSLVLLTGRLKQESWVDSKTNGKRSRIKVVAQRALHVEAQYAEDPPEREPGEEDVPY
jgi:single-strand DNA-binding protein